MSWIHVSNSGAQATSGSQTSLSATFPGTIAAGDLIVVSVAFYGPYAPTVQDTTNTTIYTYLGPTPGATQQIGTWYYIAINGGSSFEVTVTGNGAAYLAMTIDAYSLTSGDVIGIDSSGYASGTSATPTLSPALSVTTTDLVYVACVINGTPGTVSAGTGFAIRYSEPIIGGQSYGIAAEDYANESSGITPSFSFADSTTWGLNAIAFKAISQSVTIVGPSQGLYNAQQEFSLSLAGPAGAGGIVVTLASSNGSDTFHATSGGATVTSITIPASALSANFYFAASSTGIRTITIASGSISCPNSPYSYDALAVATSYTVTGASGGHQLVPVTWTIALVGGDFAGTITGTPGGGTGQCQIFSPIVITFAGNGTLSQTFTFTPLDQDSVTFTFTNSGSLTNPSPKTYVATRMYYQDTFVRSSGTSIASHTSNTLSSGLAGSGYTVTGGTIELDGSGMVFQSATGPSYAITEATVPTYSTSVSFEVLFDLLVVSSISGSQAGVMIMMGSGNVYVLYEGSSIAISLVGLYNVFSSTTVPPVGTLWHCKLDVFAGPSIGLYYSTDNINWTWLAGQIGSLNSGQFGTTISVGPYFASTTVATPTTGVHIGNIVVQDIEPAGPNCQIATSPVGTAGAYVSTSGQAAVFFFEQIGGGAVTPTGVNYAPSFYKNGSFLDWGTVTWITGYHPCAMFMFPEGTQIASTDVVTVTALASWMACGSGYASNAIPSPLTLTNYTGQSCFGTAELVKTFKPGYNMGGNGEYAICNVAKNWRLRASTPQWLGGGVAGGYGYGLIFLNLPYTNTIDSTGYPGLVGYWAIGFDDTLFSTTPMTVGLASYLDSGITVTPVTGNNNNGASQNGGVPNGQNQYYLFEVSYDESVNTSANTPLEFTYWNGYPNPQLSQMSNLWIVGPGDFTVPPASGPGATTWTFDRSNPYALSNRFLATLANSVGTLRWMDATIGSGTGSTLTQPWELPQLDAFSWDGSWFPTITIAYSEARPFATPGSYLYQEFIAGQVGSTWTCSSGLSAAITDTTSTTITIDSAYTDPIFSGVLIQIDSEQMYVQSLPGATTSTGSTLTGPNTLTVVRGAFGTTAATHVEGAAVTILSKRWAPSSLGSIADGPAQLVEFVTTAPHGLQGLVEFPLGGNFPTFNYSDGSTSQYSGVVTGFSNVQGPFVTGPNTFVTVQVTSAASGPVTLEAPQSLSSSTSSSWNPTEGGFPPEFIAIVTGAFPGAEIHVNIPLCATDAYVYDVAGRILSYFPAGRKVWLELADEPWNYFFLPSYFCPWLTGLSGGVGNGVYYYIAMRTQQIRTIFQGVFGSRDNEIHTLINNQFGYAGSYDTPGGSGDIWVSYTGTPTGAEIDEFDPLQLAAYLGCHVDGRAAAPYTDLDDSATTIAAYNNATSIAQMLDIMIHDWCYCNNPAPGTGGWNAWINAQQADCAAYTEATGTPCVLYGYEGGGIWPTGGVNNLNTLSHDLAYHPNSWIIEQDMYAMYQRAGFVALNIYSYDFPMNYTSNWGVYHGLAQLPGRGDGSDGRANNLLWFCTPPWIIDWQGTAATNQDLNTVSVRGQAFLEWMQPAQGKKRMLFVPYRFVNR